MIHTLGSDYVNFYLLDEGGHVTIIDTGCPDYLSMLEPALAEIDRSLGDVEAIVLTHADPDHTGFAGELHASHKIPVYVHRDDSERAREGKAKKTEGSPLAMLPGLRHKFTRRMMRHMMSNGAGKQQPIAEVIPFDDGDELDVPGRLQVIHTPGHSDGHCALYAPADSALFVGDAVGNFNPVNGESGAFISAAPFTTSVSQMRASLPRIAEVDSQILYFGHGQPSTRPPLELVEEALAR